jgi:hypothetical protein
MKLRQVVTRSRRFEGTCCLFLEDQWILLIFEQDGNKLFGNVGIRLPCDAASCPRRTGSLFIDLFVSHIVCYLVDLHDPVCLCCRVAYSAKWTPISVHSDAATIRASRHRVASRSWRSVDGIPGKCCATLSFILFLPCMPSHPQLLFFFVHSEGAMKFYCPI